MTSAETKAAAAKEFKSRWIAYGMNLFNRAEAHGVNWRAIPMEQLSATVILHEEFAMPDEYKSNPFINQPLEREYHG